MVTTSERVALGAFVVVDTQSSRGLGVGKVVELSGRLATVAYFDVPGDESALQIKADVSEVRVVSLPAQTRVFRYKEDADRWQVGRIIEGSGLKCLVAFPNQETVNLPRDELQVRWRKPIANPIEFLVRQVTETPLFADTRSRFVQAVTAQRAACRGIGAILSSSVQLADYQFNVVRKVLQDPIQRYLLADEVGLGKTIEAGLLIRQYTMDVPDAKVLLIVPPSLLMQWRNELIQRFGLRDWLDDYIWVISSEDISGVTEHITSAGMIVVDEAHHLSRRCAENSHPLYELLRKHARSIPRLFLLSGTPVLADTEGFLRILHLLDPIVFPLGDLDGFERRLKSRQLVAEITASLQPENVLTIENDLDRLRETFGDDLVLMKRVDALQPIVASLPDEDDEVFLVALEDLRTHLSEAYKLHRRVLRNRRKVVSWATPQRKGLEILRYSNRRQYERQLVIEDLRVYLVNSNESFDAARAVFSSAVNAGSSESLEGALIAIGIKDANALNLARQVDDLKRRADETGEREWATHNAIRNCLSKPGVQVVVFCNDSETAGRLAVSIGLALGGTTEVLRHDYAIGEMGSDEDEKGKAWRRFLSEPGRCRVLVCDARAEEGLNLHGGHKVALHYDLPSAPNRIEQRLGRLDRFGVGNAIRSLAPVCEDDAVEVAWVECLNEGLQVFNVSLASLQYLVESTLKAAIQDWWNEGVAGLLRWKEQLAGSNGWAARERRRIDQQDSLDAMGDARSEEFESLEEIDSDWKDWRESFDGFAFRALLFRRRPEDWKGDLPKEERVFRLNYVRDDNHKTLLSLPDFVSQFLGTIDAESRHSTARSPLSYPYAYNRNTVLSKEGQARGLQSLRYGNPLIESLTSFCQTDDRGRVFAMWRHRPAFEAKDGSGCDLWFRFDFIVEANLPDPNDDVTRALRRRVEQHFAPRFYTVWVSMSDGATLHPEAILLESYRNNSHVDGRDFNLNPRRWHALQSLVSSIPWLLGWRRHCETAAESALVHITNHELFRRELTLGLDSLRRQHSISVSQIESRLARLGGVAQMAEKRDLVEEEEFFLQLSEAIRLPVVRVDVAGAVFVSANDPFAK